MIKKIAFGVVAFFVCFISILALTQPASGIDKKIPKDGDIESCFQVENITYSNRCDVFPDGFIRAYGDDSYLVFEDFEKSFQTVVVRLAKPLEKSFLAKLFYKNELSEFNEEMSVEVFCNENSDYICFSIPESDEAYTGIRIDIDENYFLSSIELHTEKADNVIFNQERKFTDYIIAFLVATLFVILIFSVDYKFLFIKRFFVFFTARRKGALMCLIMVATSLAIAVIAEILLSKFVFGPSSNGQEFNVYRCLFLGGCVCLVAFLASCFKFIDKKFENVLLGIILIIGTTMILIMPAAHLTWDIESHYAWVRNASYIGDANFTEADYAFKYVKPESFAGNNLAENEQKMELIDQAGERFISFEKGKTVISHRLAGLLVAWARFFGASFTNAFIFGRFGNLIIYALVCYFAAKKLKSGKIILSVIALFPTNMLLATNYSYDYWVTSFMILGMSYFISELQQPDKEIGIWDSVIMCGSFALSCLPKYIYAPMLLIPFLMYKNKGKFTHRKRYYAICALSALLLVALLALKTLSVAGGPGDSRGGDVNPGEQIRFILTEPISYAKILLKFLSSYLSITTNEGYIVHFAYLGMGVGAGLITVMLILAMFTDKSEYDVSAAGWLVKAATLVLYFGLAAVIATALFVQFTPVGMQTVNGCQSRYIMPLIFPVAAVFANCRWSGKLSFINKKVYNYAFMIPCCVILMYNFYNMVLLRMV